MEHSEIKFVDNKMADDVHKVNKRQEKKRFKTYAKEVLGKSTAIGVMKIVETKHPIRKIIKVLVLLVCMAGCVYQSVELLLQFLNHPTTMDIDIIRVDEVVLPAITMCETPQILIWQFCEKYPKYCLSPNRKKYCIGREVMCVRLERLLGNLQVPKRRYWNLRKKQLLHNFSDVVKDKTPGISSNGDSKRWALDSQSLDYFREEFGRLTKSFNKKLLKCYLWNIRVNSSLDPLTIDFSGSTSKQLGVDLYYPIYPEELQMGEAKAHSIFLLHSPFTFENPIKTGYPLKAGHWYTVNVHLEERFMLPAPYLSDCFDYEKYWEEDRTRPRSREMCLEKCELDNFLLACNCSLESSLYPVEVPACGEWNECSMFLNETFGNSIRNCEAKCKTACHETNYFYTVKDETILGGEPENHYYSGAQLRVRIDNEIKKYQQRPKYEFTDLFGIMGGLVGLWLGAALVSFADFLESLVVIGIFHCRKRKEDKGRK